MFEPPQAASTVSLAATPDDAFELDTFPPPVQNHSTLEPTSLAWHPKVTAYRLLLTVVTLGSGTAKAVTSAWPGSTYPITIEWIGGVLFLLIAFFLTQYESSENAQPRWFFKYDVLYQISEVARELGVDVPRYVTEERRLELLIKPKRPAITGYRLLVTLTAVSFGMTKAFLSYWGGQAGPSAVEWIYGVVISLSLYWLGLYEASTAEVMPYLFVTDYSTEVASTLTTIRLTALHLMGLALAGWWSQSWFNGIEDLLRSGWTTPPSPGVPPTLFEAFFKPLITLMWVILASLGALVPGILAGLFVFYSLVMVILLPAVLPLVSFVSTRAKRVLEHAYTPVRDDHLVGDGHSDDMSGPATRNWFCKMTTNIVHSILNPPKTLEIVCFVLCIFSISIAYVAVHVVVFIVTFGWTLFWYYSLDSVWIYPQRAEDLAEYLILALAWSSCAVPLMLLGFVGTVLVIISFIRPVYQLP